jgi:hypothetical protein
MLFPGIVKSVQSLALNQRGVIANADSLICVTGPESDS